jgi:predicted nucleotidyltransferase
MPFRDYEEFIAALNGHGVRYLVVGAHAVALHARPRATQDLDIWLDPDRTNARRALDALRAFFGGTDLGYGARDLMDPTSVIQIGVAPVRIDLFSAMAGCPRFEEAWKRRAAAGFGSVKTQYLGLEDLIQAKRAAGRTQDRADIRSLERAKAAGSSVRRPRNRR